MKKLILLFSLSIFIQNTSAQEKQIEINQSIAASRQGSEPQLLQNQATASTMKTDSLNERKPSIWLGSSVHVELIYIIDGVLSNADDFKQINPNNIVNISVLKDANTLMCKNTNGTVIVKTKNGLTKKEKRKLKRESKALEKKKKAETN